MSIHRLDPIPAISRIETDRSDVFAVEIKGHVTAGDVENLYGLLEGAYCQTLALAMPPATNAASATGGVTMDRAAK